MKNFNNFNNLISLADVMSRCSRRTDNLLSNKDATRQKDGKKTATTRQRCTMSNQGLFKKIAMLFAVLVMGVANVGMAWGTDFTFSGAYNGTGNGSWTTTTSTTPIVTVTKTGSNTSTTMSCINASSVQYPNINGNTNYIKFSVPAGYRITNANVTWQAGTNSQKIIAIFGQSISGPSSSVVTATYGGYVISNALASSGNTTCNDGEDFAISAANNAREIMFVRVMTYDATTYSSGNTKYASFPSKLQGKADKTYTTSVGAASNPIFGKVVLTVESTAPSFSVDADAELAQNEDEVTLTSAGTTIYYKWSTNASAYAANAGSTLAAAADGSGASAQTVTAPNGTGTYYLYAVAKDESNNYSAVVKRNYTITAGSSCTARTFKSGEKIYFKDQESNFDFDALWKVSSGQLYAYFWNDDESEKAWSDAAGTCVEGSWNAANAIYELTVPGSGKEYTHVLFTRGKSQDFTIDSEKTWDKTTNQEPCEGKNLFYVEKGKYADHIYYGHWGNFTPAGKTVYFDARIAPDTWTTAYVRIGHGSSNSVWGAMTKVAGTKCLYSQTTSKWASHTDFAIADKAGWAGDNAIDQPEKTYSNGSWSGSDYKMTKQTNYQQYAIENDIYICPKATSVLEHECQYYQVTNENSTTSSRIDENTTAMALPSYIVTSSGTNCTVSMVKYTADDFSTSSELASGGTVMPTQYIGVTVSPTTGYKFSSVSLTTGKYEQHTAAEAGVTGKYAILGDCEVSATCVAKTCTIVFDKEGGSGTISNVTATYGSAMPSKAENLPTKDGYTFDGFWDGDNGTGTQYYKADGTSKTNWDKDTESNTTLYAKWNCVTPTFGTNLSTSQVDYDKDASASALTVAATAGGGTVTYQWYSNNENNTTTPTILTGQTSTSYTPSTATTGTTYYYCVATNSTAGCSTTTTSNIAKIVVSEAAAYSVTYNANNGSATGSVPTDDKSYTTSDSVVVKVPGDLALSNYTFVGWNTKSDGSGTYASPGARIKMSGDLNLYAVWQSASSCPGSSGGTVFALTMKTNTNSNKDLGLGESVLLGTTYATTLTGGNVAFTDVATRTGDARNSAKAKLQKGGSSNKDKITFAGNDAMLTIYLDCALAEGDIISYTGGDVQLSFTPTPVYGNSIYTTSKSCTIPEASALIGKKIIYCWRKTATSLSVTDISITRPASCTDVSITTEPTTPVAATVGSACSITGLVAAGTSPTYEWYTCNSDGSGATAITSAGAMSFTGYTSATLGLTPTAAGSTYYKCVVSGSCGDPVTSSVVTVNATAAPAGQTALVANTLYEVPDMIPSGATLTDDDQFFEGLSANTKFELIGSASSSTTPKANSKSANDKTIDGITFDDGSMWFKGDAEPSSNIPTKYGLSFIVPEGGGKLYLYFSGTSTNIKLAKSGQEGSKPSCASGYGEVDVTAGTYYLYGTGTTAPYCFYGLKLCSTYSVTITPTNVTKKTGATGAGKAIHGKAYTATFTANTGYTLPSDATVTIGGESATKGTDYTWTISDGTATLTVPAAKVTGAISISVTGEAAAPATLYTVTFDSNGGSSVDAIEQASEGASIEMPSAPTYAGHTFQGWVIGGSTYAAGASYTPTANITAYASWKADCAGGGGSSTITIGDFETSKHDKSNGKPDDFAKYQYGYINPSAKTSANAVTITTSSGNSCYQNSGADFLIYYGNSIRIYANNTTTGGTPASFEDVTSVSLKIKNANSSSFSSFSIKVGETTVANAVALSAEYNSYKVYTVSGLSNLDGRITIINHGTGGTGKNFYIDDIAITTAGGGATCYYVTYDGNGAESGCVSDATAYTLRASVDIKDNTFVKSDSRFDGWNTSATGNGTSYAAGATLTIIEDITLYAQWVADACSAPSEPTISGTSVRTVGQTITLNAACATGADASTTYTWYKGDTWETKSQVQAALTAGEGGRIFNKASCVAGDAGKYWCEASNGDGCEAHNATGFTVTVNDAAGDEHIYYYNDENHYSDGVYSNPEGNTATLKDNQTLSSPWTICNACMTGVDSVVAHGATYDGKGNYMNAYIKLPTGGDATTKNIKFALTEGYTGTLTVKIGGYSSNPTVSLYKLTSVNGAIDGDAITPTSGEVGGVATTEDDFNDIEWPLSTAGGTYVLTVTSKTGYISQIDMTTSTTASFSVTYNGNGNTGGTVPTDDTDYASGATVTVAANSGSLMKTNYTGAGWNTANNGTGTNYVPGTGTFSITANTTLYAHWTQLITLAPGAQGTGTNNAAVSWNGSVLRGFAAHTASGYALQGYYTEPSGGTKVLNADGSFAATDIDGFVTSGKWSNTGAAPTLYAQWEASNLLKWNLKVNVSESPITTLSKESAAPTVIAVANMGNLTNNGSLTITSDAKSALTSKIATTASATGDNAGKYMSVQFEVAAGYQLVPSDIKVKVQPISHSQTTKLILEDNNSQSISYTSGSLSTGSIHTVTMTNSEEVAFTGTVTLKIYVYGTAEDNGYRLGTPIEINGSVEATCATPPTFDGLSYDATEYTVGASASAISVTGTENVDTYAWKQNDVNDRSGGEAASGTNNAVSYTPPTSTIGTKYYWCEMTNTACGITIKTPAVGITVRNATTDPTVTWSDVKLNDATAMPNYGGGNYVLRATVEETSWTGTLAASMITAPAGIRIHDVTTGTDGSDKKYIEFQFDVTTAFDRASNATIDFNLALPEAGSYSALNSVKSVTYNDCSSGAAGQVAIKMGATASTSKSNPQNYWETAGAGRLMYNYGSNMGSTNNPSGYRTADSTFNYYAASTGQKWMFQTYIAGVNKVRVVFRAAGTIKSSKATITDFYYNTEYFASPGSNAVSFGDVNANQAGYSSGEDGYIEFTVPEMAANSYGAFVTGDGNMKVYGVVLYSENAGGGGSVATSPAWSDSKADGFVVNKTQSDANFTYTISTTTNTLGAITYSSSNPSVAAVNATTGEVTITATGASAQSATITATLARSGCYQGATRTYTINVAGYSCSEPSGSIELTSGSATKCESESVILTLTGFTEDASIQWYNGESTISNGGDYEIVTTATQSTLTTTAAGTYSAIATSSCDAKRTNSITIANMDMSEQKTVRKVSQWYVKNGRPTPDIALWQLGEGETFKSVAWSNSNGTGLDFRTDTETGIVYLEGKEPNTNDTGNDIEYTLTLTVTDACGTDHALSGQTIKLTHQKNTDKHVLAFVVNGTAKGGFTEGITAAQTTSVDLYNAIAAQFDVQATNIYSTDDEQKLREYYSQYDILCITDYPNTQTKGVNSKSYVDAIGALIDIRPILTMEAYVSSLSNWKLKGVSGNPKSPTTRQYTMDLQCKDHEIFHGVTTTKIGEGDEAMYRVTVVDKSQEEYKTLDANYGDGEHKANEGYQYSKKPALQGFTYTEEMSDNDMLPLGLIDDGAGNKLQVGIERQKEMSARMMVLGINSYAMERLDGDGKTIVINALKYLMKKNAEDISDCSVYFDGSDETDPTNWDNELNWGPSYASLPLPHQEVRILKECVVKDGVVARASGIKIIPRGRINHDTDDASGSLTIEPGGALIVDGEVRAATAPNYFNAYPTTPSNLVLQSNSSAQAALILDNSNGETQATVQMWNPSYWVMEGGKKKKYWSYVAVPIQEADIPNFFWYGFTYLYDETSGWIKKGDGTSLYPFQGIGASLQTGNMETFYGPLATTESQDITLTYTADKGQGMNLIGNSWTAPIQIANFEEDDFGDAAAEVWVFNTGNKNDGVVTATEENDGAATAGQWLTIPIGVAGLPGYTGLKVIPAMQAFEVNTTTETTLHLDYDRLVRAGRENLNEPMRAPRRSAAKQIEATMRVRVSGELTHTDVYLLKDARFSDGFDNGWDGHYLSGDDRSAKLYAISEEEGKLAFLAQPEIEGTQLGFAPSKHGNEYTFSFSYDGDEEYYLNDIKLKTSTLISEEATYSFTYGDGDTNRFYISRTPIDAPQTSTGVDNTGNGEVKARKFIYRDKMYILINGRVYSADGALVK